MTSRRVFPLDAITAFLPRQYASNGTLLSDTTVAERILDIPRARLQRTRRLTEDEADRLALELGLHPLLVWDNWDTQAAS